jgi:hypothetical protein
MPDEVPFVTDNPLRTPRAAAVAGILFALLLGTAIVLARLAIPAHPGAGTDWLTDGAATVKVALGLVPFAGIAFLWFMGVVRDRFGSSEDRFFSTVFLGSGLLFLAMLFVWAGTAGGLIASYSSDPDLTIESGIYVYAAQMMYGITSIYVIRMAGVFMISLGTIWIRTGTMPRWLAILTYGVSLVLLVSVSLSPWMALVFPGWVMIISVYILTVNFRSGGEPGGDDPFQTEG